MVSLEGARGVMGGKTGRDELVSNLDARRGSLVCILGQFGGRKELGFRTRSLGAGRRKEEELRLGWRLLPQLRPEVMGSGLAWLGEQKTERGTGTCEM